MTGENKETYDLDSTTSGLACTSSSASVCISVARTITSFGDLPEERRDCYSEFVMRGRFDEEDGEGAYR